MQGRVCKNILRLAPGTVNGAAEYELGRDNRKWRMFCRIARLWCRIWQVEK
jgi:hypothetical protein